MTPERENELLVQLQTDVSWIKKNLENHLKHHFLINLMAWGATISAIFALIIALIPR